MNKSTPGPWHIMNTPSPSFDDHGWRAICYLDATRTRMVAVTKGQMRCAQLSAAERRERGEANARLIAAAPELLDMLKRVLPKLAHHFECATVQPTEKWAERGSVTMDACTCIIADVKAAIAKAEGK